MPPRSAHTQSQWRSCAFNRGPMTMPVLDGPMTMPVLDGVKPMAITLPICGTSESLFWKRKKSIYCWTRSRPTWTFGESNDQVRDKSESKYQRVQDKSETIEKRLESGLESETGLEYYSPKHMHSQADSRLVVYRFILFYFVSYVCINVAPWSCEARHLVPLYVHTCSGMTIKLNLTWNTGLGQIRSVLILHRC